MNKESIALLIKGYTGYEITAEDEALLHYLYDAEVQHVLNDCNVSELPAELVPMVERVTAGQFLSISRVKVLGDEALDVVKSIKLGDTTVELGGVSAEDRLNALIAVLTKERDLSCFRRLRW